MGRRFSGWSRLRVRVPEEADDGSQERIGPLSLIGPGLKAELARIDSVGLGLYGLRLDGSGVTFGLPSGTRATRIRAG